MNPLNVQCRGCRTEIDLNTTTCPICTRPRDRSEILEDSKRLREAAAEAKARPMRIAVGTLLVAVLGYGAWYARAPLLSAIASVKGKAGAAMDKAGDPSSYAPSAAPAAAPAPAAPAAPAPAAAPALPGNAPAVPGAPVQAAAPEPLAPVDWTPRPPTIAVGEGSIIIRGWVYDLVTARPVPNAAIRLRDRVSGQAVGISSGPEGWYETYIPRENSGLTPEASAPGYRVETIAENEPPWHERKAGARRKAALGPLDEVMLTFTPRQEEADVNFVLVPLKP